MNNRHQGGKQIEISFINSNSNTEFESLLKLIVVEKIINSDANKLIIP